VHQRRNPKDFNCPQGKGGGSRKAMARRTNHRMDAQ
jgi:hypothetical protein